MTARPLRLPLRDARLRVIAGRQNRRPAMAPWIVVSVIAVATFLALIGTRTALDRSALELSALEREIAAEATSNQRLRIEIAELENPARIAPMAEELGLVIPTDRRQLLVDGIGRDDGIVDPDYTAAQTVEASEPSP